MRDRVVAPVDIAEEQLKQMALAGERVKKFMDGNDVQRIIVVPQKLVKIVVR
ncbi:hypothetical protein L0337_12295 [candidate division KSB1 bacterium]|nr:hypothetical protein [candidate division KSB1 bacterium]